MKTSNIIILSAFLIMIAGIFVNAFQLKNMYLAVDWSDPYRDCIKSDIPANIRAIYLETRDNSKMRSSQKISVIKGEKRMFAVHDTSQFKLIPVDSGLIIRTKVQHGRAYIILPELTKLQAANREDVTINGFSCDSLILRSDTHSSVTLENCNIRKLAVQNNGGKVSVSEGNTVKIANILLHEGTFVSNDIPYEKAVYAADTKSSVNLSGRSVGTFR